jgi:hypothetical protein
VTLLAAKALLALGALHSVRMQGARMAYPEMLGIVSVSQLGKYVPGGVMHFLGRGWMYSRRGMGLAASGRAMIVENIWQWTAALLVGLGFLAAANAHRNVWLQGLSADLMVVIGPLSAAGLACWWWVSRVTEARLGSRESPLRTSRLRLGIAYFTAWSLMGLSFLVLWPVEFQLGDVVLAIGAFAASSIAGFAVPVAPAGLGVREAALVVTTAGRLSADEAVIAAGLNRLVWIGSELLLASVAYAIFKVKGDGEQGRT